MEETKIPFRPVRCIESALDTMTPVDGHIVFTTDTRKIFMATSDGFKMMGGSSGVYYGTKIYASMTQMDIQVTFSLKKGQITTGAIMVDRFGSIPAVGNSAGILKLQFLRSDILNGLRDNLSTDEEKVIFDDMFSTVTITANPEICVNDIFHGEPGTEFISIPSVKCYQSSSSHDKHYDCIYYDGGYVLNIISDGSFNGSTEGIPATVAYKSKYVD
jgi:hypothetical protein